MFRIDKRLIAVICIITIILLNMWPTSSESMRYNAEQLLAVSSDGQVVDFQSIISTQDTSDQVRYTPPFKPGEFTPDNLVTQRVIGVDDRMVISDTTTFPWSTVVKVEGAFGAAPAECSGWMLGPSTVVTAGPCVYDFCCSFRLSR